MEERDLRRAEFLEAVFEAYLTVLEKTDQWLLQSELEVAAMYFKKKVIIYQPEPYQPEQPEPGKDNRPTPNELNPNGAETVRIWYNGINHYERAKLCQALIPAQ
jgi:hypothetical protein